MDGLSKYFSPVPASVTLVSSTRSDLRSMSSVGRTCDNAGHKASGTYGQHEKRHNTRQQLNKCIAICTYSQQSAESSAKPEGMHAARPHLLAAAMCMPVSQAPGHCILTKQPMLPCMHALPAHCLSRRAASTAADVHRLLICMAQGFL